MTIVLPDALEKALYELARSTGRSVESIAEEALRDYLTALATTDVSDGDRAATQLKLIPELSELDAWQADAEPDGNAAG